MYVCSYSIATSVHNTHIQYMHVQIHTEPTRKVMNSTQQESHLVLGPRWRDVLQKAPHQPVSSLSALGLQQLPPKKSMNPSKCGCTQSLISPMCGCIQSLISPICGCTQSLTDLPNVWVYSIPPPRYAGVLNPSLISPMCGCTQSLPPDVWMYSIPHPPPDVWECTQSLTPPDVWECTQSLPPPDVWMYSIPHPPPDVWECTQSLTHPPNVCGFTHSFAEVLGHISEIKSVVEIVIQQLLCQLLPYHGNLLSVLRL